VSIRGRLTRLLGSAEDLTPSYTHEFASQAPNLQQTLDIFRDQWITAFPDDLDVEAGWVNHFDPTVDTRVPWANGVIPDGLRGKSILELGPFEGYHTAMFQEFGAKSVTSVEASRTAYLKCLVVKEVLGLDAEILYGDVPSYLAASDEPFDVVWASGILYHQAKPVDFLEAVASRGNYVFLHTHFYDAPTMSTLGVRSRFNSDGDEIVEWRGRSIALHRYEYETDTSQGVFAGGPRSYAMWMEKDDIEFILREMGFSRIEFGVIDYDNPTGPGMFLLAARDI